MLHEIFFALALVSIAIWLVLLMGRGQFWRSDQKLNALDLLEPAIENTISVCVVVPARNEAEFLPMTLRSLLNQKYSGTLTIIVVDDSSTDDTAKIAKDLAASHSQIQVIAGQPLPPGWSGKLWAIEQGVRHTQTIHSSPHYFLLTDADIEHHPHNLKQLVAQAELNHLELVSLMVRLRCESIWEKLLIPAFVFFFQKLYPFRWVNHPDRSTAAAAGGCILIRQDTLSRIGGISTIRQALIDDCALAKVVKSGQTISSQTIPANQSMKAIGREKIWLGLSETTRSLRPYPSLSSIWNMVARTAFTQLHYSPTLLLGSTMGMLLIYLVPPLSTGIGMLMGDEPLAIVGVIGWLLMSYSYAPTVKLYQCSLMFALSLPLVAFIYTLMTIDSAFRYWQGRGGNWKGRFYSAPG